MSFKIGQEVVYVTGKSLPKYSVHVVQDIFRLRCGCFTIDIGIDNCPHVKSGTALLVCSDCRVSTFLPNKMCHWSATSFRPVEDVLGEISLEEVNEVLNLDVLEV